MCELLFVGVVGWLVVVSCDCVGVCDLVVVDVV